MNSARQVKAAEPVMRLSRMFIAVCAVIAAMLGPLTLVWKQSYINQTSIRLESKADTLGALNREIASLRLQHSHFSSTARIERMAKSRGFEYPSSSQIEVIEVNAVRIYKERKNSRLLEWVKDTLLGERG
ncbi:MAG: hypothetical protein LBI42_00970 [Chitinispirillales bacterium]|jgi:cell division protein FtsL|nr:hypothetical protein [Chitinispirillales bacterium]